MGKISPNKPVESRGKANGKHAQSQAIEEIWVAETKKDALAAFDPQADRSGAGRFTAAGVSIVRSVRSMR